MGYFICFAAALALLGAGPARAVPAWMPDPALAGKLALAVPVTTFLVQPPRGYTARTLHSGGDTLYAWVGAPRADGGQAYVMFGRVVPPAKDRDKYTLSQALAKFMGPIARHSTGWAASPTEAGTIHGIPFVRLHWRGTNTASGRKMRGFNYLGRRGGEFFLMASQQAEPDDKAALALAEASALTFRPR